MAFKNLGTQIPRVPGVPHRAPGAVTDFKEEAPSSPVARWEKILTVLMENGEIPVQTDLYRHKRAWELAQQEDELAQLRALASQYGLKQGRPPGDYCARCASRWCVCADRQR